MQFPFVSCAYGDSHFAAIMKIRAIDFPSTQNDYNVVNQLQVPKLPPVVVVVVH
jgi:hypothetical protein